MEIFFFFIGCVRILCQSTLLMYLLNTYLNNLIYSIPVQSRSFLPKYSFLYEDV